MKWIKSLFYMVLMSLALYVYSTVNGMSLLNFIDPPSMLFVAAGWIFVFINYPPSEIIQAFLQAMGLGAREQSPQLSLQILSNLAKYGFLAAGVSTLLGVVQALGNLDVPKELGGALAISLLSLIFAQSFYLLIILPLQNNLNRQIIESEG